MYVVKNLDMINKLKINQVEKCIEAVKNYPKIKRLIIFGSSVTDKCDEESDLDICFDVTGSTKGVEMYHLLKDIGKACDYNYDYLTYSKTNGRIKKEIDEKGVVVYELS